MTLSFRTESFIFDFYSSHQSRISSFTKRRVTLEFIIGMKSRVRSLLVYTLNLLLSSISFIFSRSSIDLLDLSLLIVLKSPRYTLPSQNESIGTHIDLICFVIWNVIGLRILLWYVIQIRYLYYSLWSSREGILELSSHIIELIIQVCTIEV